MALFEPIFEALNRTGSRYVVVGGLAVVLQGYTRLTVDLDLVVDLEPVAAGKTISALTSLGLRPRAPVDPMGFADPAVRRGWIEQKGFQVFSFIAPTNPLLAVDLFVEPPLPFEELWARAREVSLGEIKVRVASVPDLLTLKRRAGRPQDLADIAALELLEQERRGGEH